MRYGVFVELHKLTMSTGKKKPRVLLKNVLLAIYIAGNNKPT